MNVLVLNPGSESTKNYVRDLIYGCWCKGKRIGGAKAPPLNLLYVATVLSEAGIETDFFDALAEQQEPPHISEYDIVIISTSTMSFLDDARYLGMLKQKHPGLKTIVFGSHPTFEPAYCLRNPSVDYIVQQEPELVTRALVKALAAGSSLENIKGIGFLREDKPVVNPPAGFIDDLDALPIPDRSLLSSELDYFNPIVKRVPYTTAMTSRGCPGLCTFCNVPDFYGNKFRFRSAENVIAEIEQIAAQGYKEIWFRDETFTVFRKRNNQICKYIIDNKIDVSWICNARVGTITKRDMQLMKQAGCHMVKFGVESGNQHVLDNVKKGIRIEGTRKVFRWAHEVGLDTHAHVMLGMPGDSEKTIEQTLRFVKEIDPTTATFGICTPYAGTPLFKEVARKDGSIRDGSSLGEIQLHVEAYYNRHYTDIDPAQLNKYVRKAYRSFYFRPAYVLGWLKRIRNVDELRRVMLAATNVFSFSITS